MTVLQYLIFEYFDYIRMSCESIIKSIFYKNYKKNKKILQYQSITMTYYRKLQRE
jgi:hypothetical protein